jgi:hypothetical protein
LVLNKDRIEAAGKELLTSIFDKAIPSSYLITGRIRDLDNNPVQGFTVQAFDKDLIPVHPDKQLGEAQSGADGGFEISFDYASDDPIKKFPKLYLALLDKNGKRVLTSSPKENTTGRVDFEIKSTALNPDPKAPNIYADSANRLAGCFSGLINSDSIDLSLDRSLAMWNVVFGAINSWALFRDQTRATFVDYDGIQVPEIPRQKKHDHITRWDEAVLPQ